MKGKIFLKNPRVEKNLQDQEINFRNLGHEDGTLPNLACTEGLKRQIEDSVSAVRNNRNQIVDGIKAVELSSLLKLFTFLQK